MIRQINNRVVRIPSSVAQSQPPSSELDALELAFLGSLLPGIIHNLATPLSGVLGATQLLEHRSEAIQDLINRGGEGFGRSELLAQIERNRTNVEILSRNAQHLAEILKILVQRVNRGGGSTTEHTPVNEFLQGELKFLDANLHFKHRVKKELTLSPDQPIVNCIFGHVAAALDEFITFSIVRHDISGGSMSIDFATNVENSVAEIRIVATIPQVLDQNADSDLLQLYLARLQEGNWKTEFSDGKNSLRLSMKHAIVGA